MQLTAAQKTWTRIRPVFKAEFAAFSDDKLIIDGLAKLTHRPNENPRMFFSRLEELVFVLKENYASYRVKPNRPPPIQPQGTYTEDALTKYANDSVDAFANFLFTQMFKAAAPENVRRLLSHKNQSRISGGSIQSFLQGSQDGNGQKALRGACGHRRIRKSGPARAGRCCFQTSTTTATQATELQ
jgi:hypothetical protein